jgi:lipid A 3-O-deacylase
LGRWGVWLVTVWTVLLAVSPAVQAESVSASTGSAAPEDNSEATEDIAPVMPTEPTTGYWGIQFENDFLGGGGTDRYYTQGLEISYARKGKVPDWLSSVADRLPTYDAGGRSGIIYSIGQSIFTPADITANPPDPTDRPYAGFLYGTIAYVSSVEFNPNLQHVNVLELMAGIVGPSSLAEELQNTVHPLVHAHLAEGWDYQLNDELGLGATYVHKWRLFEPSINGTEMEVSPHTAVMVGNVYTYLAGGVMFRWGHGLKRDMGPPNIRPGFVGSTYFVPSFDPSWYVFMGYETRMVARNIFLDGNTFVDSPRVTRDILVGDAQFGFAIHRNKWRFAFSNVVRTREFTTQKGLSQFGSLNISYYF